MSFRSFGNKLLTWLENTGSPMCIPFLYIIGRVGHCRKQSTFLQNLENAYVLYLISVEKSYFYWAFSVKELLILEKIVIFSGKSKEGLFKRLFLKIEFFRCLGTLI